MNLGAEEIVDRVVDHPVLLEASLPAELVGNDHGAKVATPRRRTRMPDVPVALVVELEVRPRDAWLLPRKSSQPLELVTSLVEGLSLSLEAAAHAENVDDLFRRLEACETLVRIDPTVEPTMYRCASISDDEVESLRRIENVVRQGRAGRRAPSAGRR